MERPDGLVWVERLRKEKEAQMAEGKLVRISEAGGEEEGVVEEAGFQVGAERTMLSFPNWLCFLARTERRISPVFPISSSLV